MYQARMSMSRDKYSPRDDENQQEPEDIIRFQTSPRSLSQRRREARDEKLRRIRPSSPQRERERESRYRDSDPTTTRPRQTRNSREEEPERSYRQEPPPSYQGQRSTRPIREDTYIDDEPRTTRPRPSRDSREYDYPDERYTNTPRRRESDIWAGRDTGYEAPRRPARRSGTRSSLPGAPVERPQKRRAHRSVWSTLLIGVVGGIITVALVAGIGWFFLIHTLQMSFPGLGIGTSTYTSTQQTVPLNITSSITQLQVTNNVGSISISDDSSVTSGGTLTFVKKTQASSASSAASDFARIQVKAQPGNSAACPATSCMTVSASAPPNAPATVDMTIVLPAQNPTPQFVLTAATQTGNIAVQGFNGLLTLTVDTGNVNVKGSLMAAGSCLQDRVGNIVFAGTLETGVAPTINPCQGNPVTSGASQPWYKITSGTGNVDVTLNSISANIILDAAVFNQGKIISAFPIAISSASPPSYDGPLLPGKQPTAILLLTADTGNITLHKV
jgi:hypothetical protein